MNYTLAKPFIKTIIAFMLAIGLVLAIGNFIGVADAQNSQAACDGLALTGETCTDDPDIANSSISTVVGTIVDILSIIVGAVSVIMIIIGGLRYVVSNGDPQKVTAARQTILYAVVGLVIVIFAQVIVAFTIDSVSGTTDPDDGGYIQTTQMDNLA